MQIDKKGLLKNVHPYLPIYEFHQQFVNTLIFRKFHSQFSKIFEIKVKYRYFYLCQILAKLFVKADEFFC